MKELGAEVGQSQKRRREEAKTSQTRDPLYTEGRSSSLYPGSDLSLNAHTPPSCQCEPFFSQGPPRSLLWLVWKGFVCFVLFLPCIRNFFFFYKGETDEVGNCQSLISPCHRFLRQASVGKALRLGKSALTINGGHLLSGNGGH